MVIVITCDASQGDESPLAWMGAEPYESPEKTKARVGGPLKSGAGNRNRTYDLRITNAPLYQLSYSGKEPQILRCGA